MKRFTDRARKAMQLANKEAQRLNHAYLGTEHILLGVVSEGSGVAATVLKNRGVKLHDIRRSMEKLIARNSNMAMVGMLPRMPRAKKVIEYAMEETRNLGHAYIGTEHVLMGLLREGKRDCSSSIDEPRSAARSSASRDRMCAQSAARVGATAVCQPAAFAIRLRDLPECRSMCPKRVRNAAPQILYVCCGIVCPYLSRTWKISRPERRSSVPCPKRKARHGFVCSALPNGGRLTVLRCRTGNCRLRRRNA